MLGGAYNVFFPLNLHRGWRGVGVEARGWHGGEGSVGGGGWATFQRILEVGESI